MIPRNEVTKVVLSAFFAIALAFQAWAQSPSISDQTLKVGEQTFRYLSAGTDGPPIVLLHGWPQSADKFRSIIPYLEKNYIVYAPDLSGIGYNRAASLIERMEQEGLVGKPNHVGKRDILMGSRDTAPREQEAD